MLVLRHPKHTSICNFILQQKKFWKSKFFSCTVYKLLQFYKFAIRIICPLDRKVQNDSEDAAIWHRLNMATSIMHKFSSMHTISQLYNKYLWAWAVYFMKYCTEKFVYLLPTKSKKSCPPTSFFTKVTREPGRFLYGLITYLFLTT